ncbi:MAG: hypothetical protein Q8O03_02815 [Nanoarchaeota archaeon]|nr:hypothetical protein [Nanoarchaeota archaeon]
MKNLKVTGITLKQDRKVYVSYSWKTNPLPPFPLTENMFKHNVEYSGKRVSTEQICYRDNILDENEIVISGDIAKELGVTVGGKINIRLRLFGKLDNDYLTMYKKKPRKFIKYFSEQSDTNKKKVLKEILEQDFVNERVVVWLDKNYSGLIREVGLE